MGFFRELFSCCFSHEDEEVEDTPQMALVQNLWADPYKEAINSTRGRPKSSKGKERYVQGTSYTRGPNSPSPAPRRPMHKPEPYATGPYSTLALKGGASQSAHDLSDAFVSVPPQRPVKPKASSIRESSLTRYQFYELEDIDLPLRPDPVHPGYRKDYYKTNWTGKY